jgi:glycosyltransferase involved in cell wall biosynthesis
MHKKLSVVIPAYNESKTIHLILDKVRKVELINGIIKEIVVVDDCSSDGTFETIQNYISNKSA